MHNRSMPIKVTLHRGSGSRNLAVKKTSVHDTWSVHDLMLCNHTVVNVMSLERWELLVRKIYRQIYNMYVSIKIPKLSVNGHIFYIKTEGGKSENTHFSSFPAGDVVAAVPSLGSWPFPLGITFSSWAAVSTALATWSSLILAPVPRCVWLLVSSVCKRLGKMERLRWVLADVYLAPEFCGGKRDEQFSQTFWWWCWLRFYIINIMIKNWLGKLLFVWIELCKNLRLYRIRWLVMWLYWNYWPILAGVATSNILMV